MSPLCCSVDLIDYQFFYMKKLHAFTVLNITFC